MNNQHHDDPYEFVIRESLDDLLAREGDELWLWCIDCNRFFQAKSLRVDWMGNRQGCACCGAAGFDVAIFPWDVFRNDKEAWPTSTAELHHGQRLKTFTLRRMIHFPDPRLECSVYITPDDRWIFVLHRDGGDTMIAELTPQDRAAALRNAWRRVERTARRWAKKPDRYFKPADIFEGESSSQQRDAVAGSWSATTVAKPVP